MTGQKLDRLFETARAVEPQTSPEEVSRWIAGAAGAAAAVGIAAKMKLILTKKMIFMMTGTFGVLSAAVILTTAMWQDNTTMSHPAGTEPVENIEKTALTKPGPEQADPAREKMERSTVAGLQKTDDSLTATEYGPVIPALPDLPRAGGMTSSSGRLAISPPDSITAPSPYHEVQVGPFKKLRLEGIYDVVIVQGNEYKVQAESDRATEITATHEGDVLVLSYNGTGCNKENEESGKRKEKVKLKDGDGIVLHITVRELTGIEMNGIGSVTAQGLKTPELQVIFTGVGELNLDAECDRFTLESSGVGEINLSGSARQAVINFSGVGDVSAYEFPAEELKLECSGIGNVFLNATSSITIRSSGVGDVRYKGDPTSEEINFSGIGSVSEKIGE